MRPPSDPRSSRGGFHILQLLTSYRRGQLRVESNNNNDTIRVQTENIKRFGLDNDPRNPDNNLTINIDGTILVNPPRWPESHFCLVESGWQICNGNTFPGRNGLTYGPIAQIFENPLLIVYGTNSSQSEILLKLATIIANDYYLYGNSYVQIIADTNLTMEVAQNYNLIIIGCPTSNSWYNSLNAQQISPIYHHGTYLSLNGLNYNGQALAAVYLAPWSNNKLILFITDTNGEIVFMAANNLIPYLPGHQIPDYVIVNKDYAWQGYGGIVAAGYWANDWSYSSLTSYSSFSSLAKTPFELDETAFIVLLSVIAGLGVIILFFIAFAYLTYRTKRSGYDSIH